MDMATYGYGNLLFALYSMCDYKNVTGAKTHYVFQ